jgi:hypothetical protein
VARVCSGRPAPSADGQAGPSVDDPVARRRVVLDAVGLAAVGFDAGRVRGVVARLVVVPVAVVPAVRDRDRDGARFVAAAPAGAAAPTGAAATPAAEVALGGATALAAAAGAAADARDLAERRGPAFAPGFVLARGFVERVDLVVVRGPVGAWRPRIPAMRAVSSAISSRTSVSRAVRLSRLFFVAFTRRPARQASSERAAARANSSHSRWRANAAAGAIATAVVARWRVVAGADSAAGARLAPLDVASAMSSPLRNSLPFSSMTSRAVFAHLRWPRVDWPQTERKRPAPMLPSRPEALLGPPSGSSSSADVPSSAHRPNSNPPEPSEAGYRLDPPDSPGDSSSSSPSGNSG